MLRRKLLMVIAPMVTLLVLSAIAGIWILEGTLDQMRHVNQNDMDIAARATEFADTIRDLRKDVHELIARNPVQPVAMTGKMYHATELLTALEESSVSHDPQFNETLHSIRARIPALQEIVEGLAAEVSAHPESPRRDKLDEALAACNDIDVFNTGLSDGIRKQAQLEQEDLSNRFRWQVVMLAVASILIINLSLLALLRMGVMILRPVDKLVEAARQLGEEHFDVRVRINSTDEFGVLADAYNHMAERLQASEQRRIDVLGQVALAMNHELNNVINIIELQVVLVSKRCDDSGELRGHLQQIRDSLARMTKVVSALKNARRIVLTDYMAGIKMLDLQKSTQETDAAVHSSSPAPAMSEPKL